MHDTTFPDALPPLVGRLALVTGASAGLGRETARALALAGAEVILGVRDLARGAAAAAELRRTTGRALVVELVDVADFASIRALGSRLRGSGQALDVLVHNAGVMATSPAMTNDGVERQMATNHLGPFLLTAELLPCLLKADRPRVVTVTSDEAEKPRAVGFTPAELRQSGARTPWDWYGVTKLCSLLFAVELQARARAAGRTLRSTAAHPGLASTGLSGQVDGGLTRFFVRLGMGVMGQSPRGGARSLVHAATAAGVRGGELWAPGGLGGRRGAAVVKPLPALALDEQARRALWDASLAITGADFAALSSRAEALS